MPHGPRAFPASIFLTAAYVSKMVGGQVTIHVSGMVASASARRISGDSRSGRFNRLQKSSFHLDTTDIQSDNNLQSAAFSGDDDTVHLGLCWCNLEKGSLISPQQRCCSLPTAIHSANAECHARVPAAKGQRDVSIPSCHRQELPSYVGGWWTVQFGISIVSLPVAVFCTFHCWSS